MMHRVVTRCIENVRIRPCRDSLMEHLMIAGNHDQFPGALDGVRVLDVAEPLGAFVSRILGDLGADVIKIEPPTGDPGRNLSPFATQASAKVLTQRPKPCPMTTFSPAASAMAAMCNVRIMPPIWSS